MGVTNAPAGSPAAGDEEVEDVVDQATVSDPEPSTGKDEASAPSAQPSAKVGDQSTEKLPSELDKLKAKLVHAEPEVEEVDETPVEPDTPEETVEAEPAAKAGGDAETGEAAEDDNPLHGFSEKEIKHPSNKGMVTRIRDLALERKKLKQTVQEIEPIRDAGEFLTKFQADNDLTSEESVAALRLSAAFKRGDPKALELLDAAAQQLRSDLGVPDPVAETAIEPYKGALPQEYADMVSVLGFSEADVRLFAAMQAKQKAAKEAPPRQAPQRPAPRPLPAQTNRPDPALAQRLERIHIAANETVIDYLETQKIDRKAAVAHVQKNLWPYLAPLSPQNDPRRIPVEDRLRLTQLAQQKWSLAQAKIRAAAKAKAMSVPSPSAAPSAADPKPPKTLTEIDKLKARMVAKR